jgi:hypothetical protein
MAFARGGGTPPPRGEWAASPRGSRAATPTRRSGASALLGDDDAAVRAWAAGALAPSPSRATPPSSPRGGGRASPRPASAASGGVVYASFTPSPAPPRGASRATTLTAEPSTEDGSTPDAAAAAPAAAAAAAAASTVGADGEVISVCIRMRGLNEREAADGIAWKVDGKYVWEAEAEAEAEARGGDVTAYEFPAVFGATSTQQDIYGHVRPVVLGFLSGASAAACAAAAQAALRRTERCPFASGQFRVGALTGAPLHVRVRAGYNGTIFAYGQTSAGKTYTMQARMQRCERLSAKRRSALQAKQR